ncbi:hypothetical protein DEU37_0964 [Microbacterium sp. AG790]|uniref:DUF6510 family protein n=1 Tax=Microbacterium sp. AG790 TaxID=2183995 RepID=UPI000EAF2B79|nr:DUF6510 family protein [Microbacterium sp. AG790]RKS93549.1 hypothetical protein DEU37_0964 [Microbacterium sp. AG790]
MTTDAAAHPTPLGTRVARVDGNALAGMLSGVFAGDATSMTLVCGHCAGSQPLAEAVVERDEYGAIVRCRGCSRTLMTVVVAADSGPAIRIAALAELITATAAP